MTQFAKIEDHPELERVTTFDGARASSVPTTRLEEVRRRAETFRKETLERPRVRFFKSCELVRVPYPTRYAFTACFTQNATVSPLIHIVNRLMVIQVDSPRGLKTILFSPSDILANAETRFFKRIGGGRLNKMAGSLDDPGPSGAIKRAAQRMVAPITDTVDTWLGKIGLRLEDVDYITYDHLHTQDLRRWLGSHDSPPLFPNAKLLVMREEWDSATGLVPPQLDWYCPSGIDGIDPSRVILLDSSIRIGEGLALVRSPGHTMGNHSLVAHTDVGLFVSSENGVSADSFAPRSSKNSAIRRYAEATGAEVIINGNTQESGLEQYISMVMEKTIAGPCQRDDRFTNVYPSSEFAGHWLFPRLAPTYWHGDLEFGALARSASHTSSKANAHAVRVASV